MKVSDVSMTARDFLKRAIDLSYVRCPVPAVEDP